MTVEQAPRITVVYLLAASHSGSTLTAMLLGAHPAIRTIGELKATALGDPDRYRCSCREPIRACGFWQAISAEMARRGLAFEITDAGTHVTTGATPYVRRLLRPLHRGPLLEAMRDLALALSPAWRRRYPEIRVRNLALLESIAAVTGQRVIVDSSKIGIRLKYLLRMPEIDVKVVRVIRDGRAVALTYMDPEGFADASEPALRGGGGGLSRDGERLPMEAAAREWLRSNQEAQTLVDQLGEARVIQVRYEALCGDTDTTLARIFRFVGVDADAPRPNFRDVDHHVVGNGMRLDTTGEVRLDERWRSALGTEDLAIFDRVAGAYNRKLGYH